MTLLQITVLAAVQGITEFLPISSSGHLILVPAVAGWPDQSLVMDVAVHVGTLAAVVIYFWRDVWAMTRGLGMLARGRRRDPGAKLIVLLVVGTIPAVVAGGALKFAGLEGVLRSVELVAWTIIVFGLVLFVADRFFLRVRRFDQITWVQALCIGIAQAIALVPGTSRSGITMTAARMFGFERPDAARFSMLLSIPTILAAAILEGAELVANPQPDMLGQLGIAILMSAAVGVLAIAGLMAWLRRAGFTPFVIYRLLLGGALLTWVYVYGGGSLS
ncbi:MAG: undecaprenyl-diphosphate phosphatase [Alphaproteobacteria bacterium]|nr:undecaprenyl-diphosphate phosphatase [Alphaproteobacteria bacterium]